MGYEARGDEVSNRRESKIAGGDVERNEKKSRGAEQRIVCAKKRRLKGISESRRIEKEYRNTLQYYRKENTVEAREKILVSVVSVGSRSDRRDGEKDSCRGKGQEKKMPWLLGVWQTELRDGRCLERLLVLRTQKKESNALVIKGKGCRSGGGKESFPPDHLCLGIGSGEGLERKSCRKFWAGEMIKGGCECGCGCAGWCLATLDSGVW